jgi:hypothetical protein
VDKVVITPQLIQLQSTDEIRARLLPSCNPIFRVHWWLYNDDVILAFDSTAAAARNRVSASDGLARLESIVSHVIRHRAF